jgi:hypothetical protein
VYFVHFGSSCSSHAILQTMSNAIDLDSNGESDDTGDYFWSIDFVEDLIATPACLVEKLK